VRKRSRIVYRVAGGIGFPLANLSVLPYEQSFFSGGPNGVRAWRARTLGPGGYNQEETKSNARFDKTGDIILEGNFEYRFHVIQNFHGAFFIDAGNIWRLHPDKAKPNGEFKVDQFTEQIAIGGGLGVRWDLDFFVVRVDLAIPLKDPRARGMGWTFDDAPFRFTVLNFGIGYPF
jgi:outer membrane protein assembly factor BamA